LHYASHSDKVKAIIVQENPVPNAKQNAVRPRKKVSPAQMEGRRSVCPIACALDLFGDKWTLLVVRDLLLGKAHFKEFLASPEKIATNILSDRLARLVDHGIAERYPSTDIAGREAYRLTAKGRALRGLMAQIRTWGLAHIEGTEARLQAEN
jgi:DNA-binding HxlR family transcriptional regulator